MNYIPINKNLLFSFFLLLSFVPAKGQNYIFEGIIGKKEAVIAFNITGNEIFDGQYYLKENKAIIPLESVYIDSSHLMLYTLDANNNDTFSTFNLEFFENNMELNGSFKANDNIVEEVFFKWLDITKINHKFPGHILTEAFKLESPFLYSYTSDVNFNKTKKQLKNGSYDALEIVVNKNHNIPSIRFVNANDAERKIEKFCDSIGLEQVISSLDCKQEYEVSVEVKRFDRKLISILYKVKWNCGGSIEDFYFQGYTFNRKNGELLRLKDWIMLANENTTSDSFNRVAAEKNERIIRSILQESLVNNGSSICDYDNYNLFGDKNFFITQEEFHFLPSFAKSLATCRSSENSSIAIEKVKEKLKEPVKFLLQ